MLRETGTAINNIQDKGARTALAEQVGLSYEMVDAIGKTRQEWAALEKKVAEGRALTQDDLEQSEIFGARSPVSYCNCNRFQKKCLPRLRRFSILC
ncbi:hypothetical protein ArsFIN_49810 (plasmid) [Arsenophonus nasoniae]|uniref:Uncharacterized protein n=1 Tax=Arsenophonus nasoniae TaxID=638 RepID=A0A4P7L5W6_9GAMM|nr:hypothetical protein ArsFIN_49810 [Arsenophonus nasoniae]